MEEVRAALSAATCALRDAETLVLARTGTVAGERSSSALVMGELAELRQAAGDLHRAVATLVESTAGHGD